MSAPDDESGSRFPDRGITARPPPAPKRLRLALTENRLQQEKLLGTGRSDSVYVATGFRDENEYWSDRTAGVISVSDFVHTLAIHRLQPSLEGVEGYKRDLSHALNFAFENREPWCIEAQVERRLRPREAAAYLLSQPTCEHLVPAGLKAFLGSLGAPVVAEKNSPADCRPRQRRQKLDPIIEQMRLMNPAELKREKEKNLAISFGVSRDTVRKARNEVLGLTKSRSTID
jgi:hypothetical protein